MYVIACCLAAMALCFWVLVIVMLCASVMFKISAALLRISAEKEAYGVDANHLRVKAAGRDGIADGCLSTVFPAAMSALIQTGLLLLIVSGLRD